MPQPLPSGVSVLLSAIGSARVTFTDDDGEAADELRKLAALAASAARLIGVQTQGLKESPPPPLRADTCRRKLRPKQPNAAGPKITPTVNTDCPPSREPQN